MGSQICRLLHSLPYFIVLLCCATFRYAFGTKATSLRGVAPSRLPAYQNRSTFTCTSGRQEIDITRVNDDVCDCADGSDEPGTSACPNGMFHCRNQGFKPRDLPSTFVDDGVCDCCDGSDETKGCNDSCESLGQLARTEAGDKLDRYVAGAKARDMFLDEAARKLKGWKDRSMQLEETVGQLKPIVAKLNEEMQEAQRRQHEAEEAEKAGSQEKKDNPLVESPEDEREPTNFGTDDVAEYDEDDRDAGAVDPDAEAKRIASQWTSDPAAAAGGDVIHENDDEKGTEEVVKENLPESGKPKTALQMLADTAVQSHTSKKHELREAETELKTLKANVARDYGPGNVYAALQDVCLEMRKDQYKYRVCGFGKAAQIEGSSEISLGQFDRCEDNCSSMYYTQGLKCWQGPSRSMQVQLQCGRKNEIVSVEEPERCVYVAVVNTPAECTEFLLQTLRNEISQYNVEPANDVKDEL